MSGIQVVLLTGIAFIAIYFITRLKRSLLDIILLGVLVLAGISLIIWPDISTTIANKLGVGRGADLIFYVSILIFWFVVLKMYRRIRTLEQSFTSIVREQALMKAERLGKQVVDGKIE